MSPTEGGRHCRSCSKTVFDLSRKSEAELASFSQEAGKDLCIRMNLAQLVAGNPVKKPEPEPVITGKLKRFVVALLAALGFIQFSPALAQTPSKSSLIHEDFQKVYAPHIKLRVLLNQQPSSKVKVQLKRSGELLKTTAPDETGDLSFDQLETGLYELWFLHGTFVMGAKEVNLEGDPYQKFEISFDGSKDGWVASDPSVHFPVDEIPAAAAGRPLSGPSVLAVDSTFVWAVSPGIYPGIYSGMESGGVSVTGTTPIWGWGIPGATTTISWNLFVPVAIGTELMLWYPTICAEVISDPEQGIAIASIQDSHEGEKVELTLLDSHGREVKKDSLDGGKNYNYVMDMSDQSLGIYFLRIKHGYQVIDKKILHI